MISELLSLSPTEISGFDKILNAIAECNNSLSDSDVGDRYSLIGEILFENVHLHDLDEDIVNLQAFARCVACELLSLPMQVKHFRGKCWDFEPPMKKREGRNTDSSEIRPIEKQKIAMTMTLVGHLHRDEKFAIAAKSLGDFETRHSLWTEEDSIDRD